MIRKLICLIVCAAMVAPIVEAQHRPGTNGGRTSRPTTHQQRPAQQRPSQSRPGSSTGRPGNSGTRPGNQGNAGNSNPSRPGNSGTRPGNQGNAGNNNPGRPGNSGTRPGNNGNHNNNSGNRPGTRPGNQGFRPGNTTPNRPGNVQPGMNPGPRPPHANRPGVGHRPHPGPRPPYMAPPSRPYRPSGFRGPFSRPLPPPPGWRPRPGIPVINGILGLTFGTAIGISLDYLLNNGYTIDGYGNDMVYLRNVPALNYMWTDATLYYGTGGGFNGSSFYYSTPNYDLARYNAVYNSLVATYGVPVAVDNGSGSYYSTWYGGNNGFISLRFNAQATQGGSVRYFTTLSFGN